MSLLDLLPDETVKVIASRLPADHLQILLSLCRRTRQVVDANLPAHAFAASCVSEMLPCVLNDGWLPRPTNWGRLGRVFCDTLLAQAGFMSASFAFFYTGDGPACGDFEYTVSTAFQAPSRDPVVEAALRDHLERNPTPGDVCENNHFHFRLSCLLGLTSVAVDTARWIVLPGGPCGHDYRYEVHEPPTDGLECASARGHDDLVMALIEEFPIISFHASEMAALRNRHASTLAIMIKADTRWSAKDAQEALRTATAMGWDEGIDVIRKVRTRQHAEGVD